MAATEKRICLFCDGLTRPLVHLNKTAFLYGEGLFLLYHLCQHLVRSGKAQREEGKGPSVAGELLAQHQARVLDQFKLNSIDSALPDGLPVAVRLAASSIEERVYLLEVDSADVNPLAQALQASGEVEYAEPNYLYYVTMNPNDPLYDNGNNPALWGLNAIHANQAWDQTSGAGAIVAVIDTGLYLDHPDIRDNVWLNAKSP